MNILHVIIKYSQQHWGGAEGFIHNVARLHARQGHTVTVAAPNVFDDSTRETLAGVRVLRFPFFYPSFDRSVDQIKARKGAGLVSLPLLAHVATTRYDIVHLHLHNAMSTGLAYLLKALGRRFVLHIHSPYLEEPEFFNDSSTIYRQTSAPRRRDFLSPVQDLAKLLFSTRRSLALAGLVLWANGVDYVTYRNKYPGRLSVQMPNGVDPQAFRHGNGNRFRVTHGLDADQKILLCVANFYPLKNQTLALRILHELQRLSDRICLVLIGRVTDAAYMDEVRQTMVELDLARHVVIVPGLAHDSDALSDAYAACDLFLVPSRYEAFSVAIVEAMACGRVICANRVGGIPYVIRDGVNGRLFTMTESTAGRVAAGLWEMLGNPDAAAALGKAARQEAEQKYTWERIAARLLGIYTYLTRTHAENPRLPQGPPPGTKPAVIDCS